MKAYRSYLAISIALLFAGPALASDREQLLVLPERDFSQHWKPTAPEVVHLDIKTRSIKFQYGCVNLGFVVEKDGTVSSPLRLLSYRFDKPIESGPSEVTVFSQLGDMLPRFTPAKEGEAARSTYTSRSIPVRNEKFSKTLSQQQSDRLDIALRDACRIDDLLTRLTSGGKDAEQLPLAIDTAAIFSPPSN